MFISSVYYLYRCFPRALDPSDCVPSAYLVCTRCVLTNSQWRSRLLQTFIFAWKFRIFDASLPISHPAEQRANLKPSPCCPKHPYLHAVGWIDEAQSEFKAARVVRKRVRVQALWCQRTSPTILFPQVLTEQVGESSQEGR